VRHCSCVYRSFERTSMRYSLQKTTFAVIAALIPFGVLRAEVTTVILPEDPPGMLKISAEKADSVHTEQLTFQIRASTRGPDGIRVVE
jgi:hypothetical protein